MQLIVPQITAQESQLVAISPQSVEKSKSTAQELGITYPLLSDPCNRLGKRLRLVFRLREDLQGIYKRGGYDLTSINNDDSWELPVPATFIVDQEGEIRWAFVDPIYTRRAEPTDIIYALKSLRQ